MKAVSILPEDYEEICCVDLQKNKKMALFVNLLAIVIAVLMVIPMHFIVPFTTFTNQDNGFGNYIIRLTTLLCLMIIYLILHELVHGIAMRICGTKKVKYGFTGLYAFAGSDDYYDKKSYIFIALAPVVLWGIVLVVVNFLVSSEWFWVIYFIQIINLSGAAGDFFVTFKFSRFSKDILIRDHGVGMIVYSKKQ